MRQYPFYGELVISERMRETEQLCHRQSLLASQPKSQYFARCVASVGRWFVALGTWMQHAESRQAEPSRA